MDMALTTTPFKFVVADGGSRLDYLAFGVLVEA
jgi:hypothetical protein